MFAKNISKARIHDGVLKILANVNVSSYTKCKPCYNSHLMPTTYRQGSQESGDPGKVNEFLFL